jgi:DNA mismatch repair protein MutS2
MSERRKTTFRSFSALPGAAAGPPVQPPRIRTPPRRRHAPCELDLHGCRVDDALHRLDVFINDALMAGHREIRVVHGHGTGAVRNALHAYLKTLPVRGFRLGEHGFDEGGSGVTVITL